jgi:hypothetical protein
VFQSGAELEQAMGDDIEHHHAPPKAFAWTKTAADSLEKSPPRRECPEEAPNGLRHDRSRSRHLPQG